MIVIIITAAAAVRYLCRLKPFPIEATVKPISSQLINNIDQHTVTMFYSIIPETFSIKIQHKQIYKQFQARKCSVPLTPLLS